MPSLARFVSLSASAVMAVTVQAQAKIPDALGPGSASPPLSVKKWLKGEPVGELPQKGIAVIEFWATWCGPCVQTIPHVTELAKANPDVVFLGVGVWEDEKDGNLAKFVERMGDKMDYRVAYTGNFEGMATSWMDAAFQDSIPCAFIVQDRKVMWIGHPLGLDAPLAEIKAGNYDLEAFRAKFDKSVAESRHDREGMAALDIGMKLRKEGRKADANRAMIEAGKRYPKQAVLADRARFAWMAEDDPVAWKAWAMRLVKTGKEDDLSVLYAFALSRAKIPADQAVARTAIELALAGCDGKGRTLSFAVEVYKILKDDASLLKTIDRYLLVLAKKDVKDEALVAQLRQQRATLIAKGTKPGGL